MGFSQKSRRGRPHPRGGTVHLAKAAFVSESQTRRGESMKIVSQLVGCSRRKNQVFSMYLAFSVSGLRVRLSLAYKKTQLFAPN